MTRSLFGNDDNFSRILSSNNKMSIFSSSTSRTLLIMLIGTMLIACGLFEMVAALNFDVAKLPNGLLYSQTPLFKNIFFKEDGNLTLFGSDFMNNNYAWNNELCMKDSDNDGLTNGDELGDPCCSWYSGGSPARRTLYSQLSDPGNKASKAPYSSAASVANIYGFRAIPTYHSVLLKWKMPEASASVICYLQIQMSTLNAVGYTTLTYKSFDVSNFTRYNLDENKTYSFRILPYNKYIGYNSYGVGNQAIVFVTTKASPYGQGIGDNCPSKVIKWSELYGNLTEYMDPVIVKNETVLNNSTVIQNNTSSNVTDNSGNSTNVDNNDNSSTNGTDNSTGNNTNIDNNNSTMDSNSTLDSNNTMDSNTTQLDNSTTVDNNSTIDNNSSSVDNSTSGNLNDTSVDSNSTSTDNSTVSNNTTSSANGTDLSNSTSTTDNSTISNNNETAQNSSDSSNSTQADSNNGTMADSNSTQVDNSTNVDSNSTQFDNSTYSDNSTMDNSTQVDNNSTMDSNSTMDNNATLSDNSTQFDNSTYSDNSTMDNSTFDSNSTDANNGTSNNGNARSLRVLSIKRNLLSVTEEEVFEFNCTYIYETRLCSINTTTLNDSISTTRTCSYSIEVNSTSCNTGSCMVCSGNETYCNSTLAYQCDDIVYTEGDANTTICYETVLSISTSCVNISQSNQDSNNNNTVDNSTMNGDNTTSADNSTTGVDNSTTSADNSTTSDNTTMGANSTTSDNSTQNFDNSTNVNATSNDNSTVSQNGTVDSNSTSADNNGTLGNSTTVDNSTSTDNSTTFDNSTQSFDNGTLDGNSTTFDNSTSDDNSTIVNNTTTSDNTTSLNNSTSDNNSTLDNNSTMDGNSTIDYNNTNINSTIDHDTNCTTEIIREDIYDCYTTEKTTECNTNSTFDGSYYTNNTDCVIFTHIDSFTCDRENCTTCMNGEPVCLSVTNSKCSNETYISENVTSIVCNQITVNSSTVCSLNRTIINVTNCYGDNSTFILVNNTIISSNSTSNSSSANNSTHVVEDEVYDDNLYLEPERILVVPENYTVILDVIPPKLDVLHVFGCLVFSDDLDLELHFKTMIITGSLQIGNETNPHQHNASLTLHGERNMNRTMIGFGVKNILVTSGGALSLHGKKHEVSWTLLAKSAQVGDTSIHLKKETEWQVGDEIVLASTDYYHNQAERRVISVRYNSTCFGFVKPLVYGHYANTQYYQKTNGTVVEFDERGEVGLLSHNIKIRGDLSTSEDAMFGGHAAFVRSAQYVRIDNVEFNRMGQAGIPGRYPIYFQLFGDANSSYIHKVSVYDSYQRAVALQGTNRLHVEGVVAYNIYGHTFFLEDGAEEFNIFENCVGILTKSIPDSRSIMLPDNQDYNPATFFISNPNNIFIGNRAAGSDAFGFWYKLETYATGASQSVYIRPSHWYFGTFVNNTAHSNNQNGMMLYPNFYTCSDPKLEVYNQIGCGSTQNPWSEPVFENMNIWKNRQNGQYSHIQGKLSLKGSIFADNPVSYTVLNIILSKIEVSGAIFIGFTQNKGNPNNCNDGHCYRCGTDYKNPSSPYYRSLPSYNRNDPFTGVLYQRDGSTLVLQDLEFFDFVDNCERKLSSIDIRNDDYASMNQGDYVTSRLYFHNANVMYLLAGLAAKDPSLDDIYRHSVIIDSDGTLSKNITLPAKIRRANARIIPANMILVNPIYCIYVKEWNAFICDESVNYKRFEITTPAITNGIDSARINSTNGYSERLNGRLQYWGEWWYRALYMDDGVYRYSIDWTGVVGTPEKIKLNWQGSTTLSVSVGFLKWGPLQVKIEFTDGSPTRNLSPSNLTDGPTSYDCKTNIVTLPVKTEATVYVQDATYVPPGSNCVAFIDTDLCVNRSSCGGAKKGKCVGLNECVCRWGWYSETCQSFHCVHRNWCGGRGTCVGPNTCVCFPGFSGSDCSLLQEFDLVNKVLAFGDIHLRTVDAAEYTFNSIGEFFLYKSNELALQGRLMKCTAESKTSCMKGIAFMSGSDKISILSDGKTGVMVLVNDVQVYLNETKVNVQPVEADTKFVIPTDLQKLVEQIKGQVDPDTNQVANITESQLAYKEPESPILVLNGGATITQEDDTSSYYMVNGVKTYYKSITVKYSGEFKGQIKLRNDGLGWLSVSFAPNKDVNFTGTEVGGLYGTLDGNKDNEFTLRDGTVIPAPSAEQIHQVFGESWRISKNESFFTYGEGAQYEDINVLDFKPIMKASSDDPALQSLAEKACSSLGLTASFYESCMFDVLSTGLVEYAMASATAVAQDSCSSNGSCTAVLVCPNFCSLNGKCISGHCKCDLGYLGEDCSIAATYINLVGIIIGSVVGGYVAVLFICVASIVSLIFISRRYKVKNVTRMVSIVPTLDHRDELRSVCSADYEDQRIEMLDKTMGTVVFKRE